MKRLTITLESENWSGLFSGLRWVVDHLGRRASISTGGMAGAKGEIFVEFEGGAQKRVQLREKSTSIEPDAYVLCFLDWLDDHGLRRSSRGDSGGR